MSVLMDPFFWALVSMSGLLGASALVGSRRLARRQLFGALTVATFALGRVVIVLPIVPQPRYEADAWVWLAGGVLFATGMIFASPVLRIRAFTGPAAGLQLRTRGLYRLVRNPLYLSELLWSLGLAVMFRSIIGIALTPVWWAGLLLLTVVEEEALESKLGKPYLDYKQQVRGRILPGLPV
jgi:protein-S-isoprenylcysteine O-methyltransferase Ste14